MPPTTSLTASRNNLVQVAYTPIPQDAELPPLPSRADRAFGYQGVLLNVRTGELSVFCADWRVHVPVPRDGEDRTLWDAQHPGHLPNIAVYEATKPVPEVLSFHIDTWTPVDWPVDEILPTPAWVYMTREQCDAFGAGLVPLAQSLVSNLFHVPGTNDLEWSAESVAAVKALYAACSRDQQGRCGKITSAGMINFDTAAAAMPQLIQGDWAEMDDAKLDDTADTLCRFISHWHPELKEQFGVPYHDGSGVGLDVYGARSWLYAYRAHEAESRQVVGAAAWFAEPAHTLTRRVSADNSDDDIDALAARERSTAAKEGVKLVGAETVIRAYRDELRHRIVEDDLARAREAVERLAKAKAARAGLLGQIIGWGDPRYHSDNDAELARRAGLTRQAVNQLRKILTDDDTTA
jgi:hypothetical protein